MRDAFSQLPDNTCPPFLLSEILTKMLSPNNSTEYLPVVGFAKEVDIHNLCPFAVLQKLVYSNVISYRPSPCVSADWLASAEYLLIPAYYPILKLFSAKYGMQ